MSDKLFGIDVSKVALDKQDDMEDAVNKNRKPRHQGKLPVKQEIKQIEAEADDFDISEVEKAILERELQSDTSRDTDIEMDETPFDDNLSKN